MIYGGVVLKKRTIIILIIAMIILLLGLYLYLENTTLQVTKFDITNSKISKDFNNYKIIQVSDFHNTTSEKLYNDLVEEIKTQKPNIIVLTGDLIDSRKTDTNVAINFLKDIKDIAPIYYVTGNHESRVNEYSQLKEQMKNLGINILDGKTIVLKQKDSIINLIGIDDPKFSSEVAVSDSEIIKTEINALEYDKNSYTILLSHRPEEFNTYVSENIDLVFTGHAHGGQIRIPFVGGVVAPNQGFFPKYTSGKYVEKNTTMIVSRGIGNSIIPFRINNRPELIVVELRSE